MIFMRRSKPEEIVAEIKCPACEGTGYVRWCGRGGAVRLPPIPILASLSASLRTGGADRQPGQARAYGTRPGRFFLV